MDAGVRSSTRDWKTCIILGTPLDLLPGVFVTGDVRAAERLVAATSLNASHHA